MFLSRYTVAVSDCVLKNTLFIYLIIYFRPTKIKFFSSPKEKEIIRSTRLFG